MIPRFVTEPDASLYLNGTYIVLDFETTNEEKGSALNENNTIVLACWAHGQAGKLTKRRYKFGNEYEMQQLLDDIEEIDFIVAQNAKFELQWLDRCGYDVGSRPVYDTQLAEWVIGGNRWVHYELGLDKICTRRNIKNKSRIISLLLKGGISPLDMPRSLLKRYCVGDVLATHAVMQDQLKEMEGTRLLPIVYTRCLTTLPLSEIEKSGVCLDPERVEKTYEQVHREYVDTTNQLDDMSGGINMNSGPQKAEYIYKTLGFKELVDPYTKEPMRTPGGMPVTKAEIITRLVAHTEEQRKFKKLKLIQGKLYGALTKTLDFFVGVCREKDGQFYGSIQQGTTRTHRLSSVGRPLKLEAYDKAKSCQFHNFPNQYKSLIKARHEDWLVGEADGSQLEFRVGGHLGDDNQIRRDVTQKEDIHRCTAQALTDAGEPTTRRNAKASTFRPMYGGTKGSPAIEAYCKFFAKKYHQLNHAQKQWAYGAADRGYIDTEWGMRYYFPHVKVLQSGYISGQQQVFNYPIQALATAEIIPIALVHFWYRTREAELIITNTVHDSIICEIPPHEIELFQECSVQSLTTDVYDYLHNLYGLDLSVPLGVGMKFGKHWGETAYTDKELEDMTGTLIGHGYDPVVDDGEISVDIANPYYKEELRHAS
jgi:DNA polymerase I-like protein with 3'-5' exonuclease and polymerase domains